ncbi:MAG: hypothetical protein RL637_561 [Pseudomonadota bacterium]|jgi:hypothetical protein
MSTYISSSHFKQPNTWKRILFMLIFVLIVSIVRVLLWAIIALQITTTLFTGRVNQHILGLSRQLCLYLYHITLFLTFNTHLPPFPFSDWQLSEHLNDTES